MKKWTLKCNSPELIRRAAREFSVLREELFPWKLIPLSDIQGPQAAGWLCVQMMQLESQAQPWHESPGAKGKFQSLCYLTFSLVTWKSQPSSVFTRPWNVSDHFYIYLKFLFWSDFRSTQKLQREYRELPYTFYPAPMLTPYITTAHCPNQEMDISVIPCTKLQTSFGFPSFSTDLFFLFQISNPGHDIAFSFHVSLDSSVCDHFSVFADHDLVTLISFYFF